ncbi:hypothetical protein PEC302107_25010 [Pectobacterium araliae]|uniref:SH3 domain-containing protein n=1 Tax=Pectobacterium araliae TaxID=3073862 RepID=A0AAN0KL33_9GAMM|nr:hypothetical protein PEC302110_29990 [Pectobacterium sp. MAFF 302110]GKW20772.1 hypothetical protein PEC302107_25010 [Pectobacterium carotovorum subsp. carotovorum]
MSKIFYFLFFVFSLFSEEVFAACGEINSSAEVEQDLFKTSDSGYIVIERTYLYSAPNENCKLKNTFLIGGDKIDVYAKYAGFFSMMYLKKNGEPVMGWVHSSSVRPIGVGIGPDK